MRGKSITLEVELSDINDGANTKIQDKEGSASGQLGLISTRKRLENGRALSGYSTQKKLTSPFIFMVGCKFLSPI